MGTRYASRPVLIVAIRCTLFETCLSESIQSNLALNLRNKARRRFQKQPHISILQGDSATVLPRLLSEIDKPCLFWLDAHFSAGVTALAKLETPIHQELRTIFAHPIKDHTILIDDARDFNGKKRYPDLVELEEFVKRTITGSSFEVKDDIIRIRLR